MYVCMYVCINIYKHAHIYILVVVVATFDMVRKYYL